MTRPALATTLTLRAALTALTALTMTGACVPGEPALPSSTGGATANATGGNASGTGGNGPVGNSGGSRAGGTGGGATATGGATVVGSGGAIGAASGGVSGSGGRPAGSGGRSVSGGGGAAGTGTGGRGTAGGSASGGGGANSATGGRGSGGVANATGGSASGGRGTGGSGSGGMGTGGAGTGGSVATSCNLPNHTGAGSFTFYYFGQGTFREGSGYRTACGYYGTESGTTDTLQNIASMSPASATYFAAIPGTNGFNTSSRCGSCVQITGQNGRVIIATIADECPYGSDGGNTICGGNPNGHLDLSKAAFDQLGYSRGDPTGTTWRFVPCPVTGNVIIRVKTGNQNELFVENSILSIASVQGATRTSYGAWHFNSNLVSGQSIMLTDALGRTLTVELNGTTQGMNQNTGRQFPPCL